MGFFTPWFLAGAVAVGLPIWLHLLKRHKTDPKLFPSLMFFEFRETSSVKHRRLDHILLFVLRTLMLLLLALLFASPFIRRRVRWQKADGGGRRSLFQHARRRQAGSRQESSNGGSWET